MLMIAPLSLPVHGAQMVSSAVLDKIRERSVEPTLIDTNTSASNLAGSIREWMYTLLTGAYDIIRGRSQASVCYYAPSSGLGFAVELPLLLLARLCGVDSVYVHHHSFSYLSEEKSLQVTSIKRIFKHRTHICLCGYMASRVAEFDPSSESIELSNAAFIKPQSAPTVASEDSDVVNVLFLSNLTEDKGSGRIADTIRDGHFANNRGFHLDVAGPARDSSAEELLAVIEAEKGTSSVAYHGAVDGEFKADLLARADFVVLPTSYPVEAQPLVLIEGAAAGAVPVSTSRGCIHSLLDELGGRYWTDFVDETLVAGVSNPMVGHEDYAAKHGKAVVQLNDVVASLVAA